MPFSLNGQVITRLTAARLSAASRVKRAKATLEL